MKTKNILLLAIAVAFLFACHSNADHDKALKYYVSIDTDLKKATQSVNSFWHKLGEATKMAVQTPEKKLNENTVDSFTIAYQTTITEINSSIKSVSSLEEFDKEMNLKEKVLDHLNAGKSLQETFIPTVLKGLRIGLGNLSESENQLLRKSTKQNEDFQIEKEEFIKLGDTFRAKYHIKDTELDKFGL